MGKYPESSFAGRKLIGTCQRILIGLQNPVIESDQLNLPGVVLHTEKTANFSHRDPAGVSQWITVNAATDRRKSNGVEMVLPRKCKALLITAGQQFGFSRVTARPDRAHGMDDETGRQIETGGEASAPGFTATQLAASIQKLRASRTVNGPIDSPSSEQGPIGGVYDGINSQCRNVPLYGLNTHRIQSDR